MTDPEQHLRRLRAITANAILPALERKHLLPGVQPWWLPLSARLQVANGIVQALVDAGAIPPPPADPGAPRHTASDITDDQLAALYGELDEARKQIAIGQAGASARETLLTQARDALEEHGGHGDDWPNIVEPIHAMVDRLAQAEAAVQRVRAIHRPEAGPDPDCAGCGDSPHHIDYGVTWPCATIRALDNREPK